MAVGNGLSIESNDDVAGFDTGFFGGHAGYDVIHKRAVLIGQLKMFCQFGIYVLQADAKVTAHDFAAADESLHDPTGHVDWHGETDAFATAAASRNPRIDTDQPTFGVHKRTARITRINRGVGLNEIFIAIHAVDAITVTT